ncbi:MAG: hypothetical protein P4L36_13145 [Holophaga sp.]|nr:hypothetical protein [Holophaga sp.]
MDRAGLRTTRQFALWKEGLALLAGLTIDGCSVDPESHLARLTERYAQDLAEHEKSGSLARAAGQLWKLEETANQIAAALRGLGPEAQQAIFGGGVGADPGRFRMLASLRTISEKAHQTLFNSWSHKDCPIFPDEIFRQDGSFSEAGWLPGEGQFTEFAQACRKKAKECESLQYQMDGMPKFRPLLAGTPKQAMVAGCEDALLRVGRMEKLHVLVRIVAELAKGEKPGRKFERECQAWMKPHKPQPT